MWSLVSMSCIIPLSLSYFLLDMLGLHKVYAWHFVIRKVELHYNQISAKPRAVIFFANLTTPQENYLKGQSLLLTVKLISSVKNYMYYRSSLLYDKKIKEQIKKNYISIRNLSKLIKFWYYA